MNHVLDVAAIVQIRHDTDGGAVPCSVTPTPAAIPLFWEERRLSPWRSR
jgi:hypothetical protein